MKIQITICFTNDYKEGDDVNKPCRLWSPIVFAELKNPRYLNREVVYSLDGGAYRLEDIKIKMRDSWTRAQGNMLEAEFKLEVLTLLENGPGNIKFFSRNEILRDRMPRTEMSGPSDQTGLDLITDVQSLQWDADLLKDTIKINVNIAYMVLAVRTQIVEIMNQGDRTHYTKEPSDEEILYLMQAQILKAESDKIELKRKIQCFEKDIASLKNGINKAENRNLILNQQLSQDKKTINSLRALLEEKGSEGGKNRPIRKGWWWEEGDEAASAGGIIKRLFQNNT